MKEEKLYTRLAAFARGANKCAVGAVARARLLMLRGLCALPLIRILSEEGERGGRDLSKPQTSLQPFTFPSPRASVFGSVNLWNDNHRFCRNASKICRKICLPNLFPSPNP